MSTVWYNTRICHVWIEATIAPSSTSYLQLLWFPCDETDSFWSFPDCWGDVGCSIVVHFALVPLTFTNESTKLAMSMYTYQQTLPTYISCNIYTVIYIQFTETNHFSIFLLVKFSLFTNLYVHFEVEWRSKDPKCHRPSAEKGGGTSLGAFNGCYNLDLPVTVTVANIKVYRDSRRLFLYILVVTVYRVVDPSDPLGYGWNKKTGWKTSKKCFPE